MDGGVEGRLLLFDLEFQGLGLTLERPLPYGALFLLEFFNLLLDFLGLLRIILYLSLDLLLLLFYWIWKLGLDDESLDFLSRNGLLFEGLRHVHGLLWWRHQFSDGLWLLLRDLFSLFHFHITLLFGRFGFRNKWNFPFHGLQGSRLLQLSVVDFGLPLLFLSGYVVPDDPLLLRSSDLLTIVIVLPKLFRKILLFLPEALFGVCLIRRHLFCFGLCIVK